MKILVIGGGAAGMSAASKARRMDRDADITVFEDGPFVSYAECGMPYYLAGYFNDYNDLLHYKIEEFTEKRGINVITNEKIKDVDVKNRIVYSKNRSYEYDKLVIASGASPRIPDEFKDYALSLRSMEDAIRLNDMLKRSRDITIVGAGVLGTELYSLLKKRHHVRLISKHDHVLPYFDDDMSDILKNICDDNIEYNSLPIEISYNGRYKIKTSLGSHESDLVIFATGIEPNTSFIKDGIKKDGYGRIIVDDYLMACDDVYAAGDAVTTKNIVTGLNDYFPLAQVANKMGRIIGVNLFGNRIKFPGSLGTTIINLNDYQVGYTGINERTARKLNIKYDRILIKGESRSKYLHGSDVYTKIIYSEDGRLIGAQVISRENGAWRLNVLATAIYSKMHIDDLFFNDLGYEPEYGPVWDPIVIAGSLGLDKLQGYGK
ncbi:FAD-dependent oxidoreductase [Picrophilus oshimae]|uniref:NADPH-dependent 2,4-dienoyl-CoA reductase, sulfur reductase n=1 Tax=Picrophilus torridus (strain ATCC 700027 / DSM 9790 / JCM 10055 / NBRC 100828 / KAW 2/3) TaxID=1122961 RepID=A0A8G2L7D3_PICTO|nr:FAD-dependent oxidoreductase [Picrophilus oshimae]SMD30865.1 NADPH-dependent 2,4-dienoyl-CoA reductase, sulfur reductase [Picrophilus oshimae DSM 9789]